MKSLPLIILALILAACTASTERTVQDEIPLVPLTEITRHQGVLPIRAPLIVHDEQHPLVGYTADGKPDYQIHDAMLFPTDVIVVLSQEMTEPQIFLARSPHGGCLLRVEIAQGELIDPCYGSRFALTGAYLAGPAPRALDRLPGQVRDGMLWMQSQIIYGEAHSEPPQNLP